MKVMDSFFTIMSTFLAIAIFTSYPAVAPGFQGADTVLEIKNGTATDYELYSRLTDTKLADIPAHSKKVVNLDELKNRHTGNFGLKKRGSDALQFILFTTLFPNRFVAALNRAMDPALKQIQGVASTEQDINPAWGIPSFRLNLNLSDVRPITLEVTTTQR